MLQGLRWQEVLHNTQNKNDLIELIAEYMQSDDCRSKLPYDFIVTTNERTIKVNIYTIAIKEKLTTDKFCMHSYLKKTLLLSQQTLMFLFFLCGPTTIFNKRKTSFANISSICDFLGGEICSALPAFHVIRLHTFTVLESCVFSKWL